MSGHPPERTYAEIYASTPHDVWLGQARDIAITDRYPCFCSPSGCPNDHPHPGYRCPCYGRTDLEQLPSWCCAPRHPNAKEATAP